MTDPKTSPGLEQCLAAADQTKAMIVCEDAIAGVPALLGAHYAEGADGCAVFLAADSNTFKAAGAAALEAAVSGGFPEAGRHIFSEEGQIHAVYEHSAVLKDQFEQARRALPPGTRLVPIAAGSGTVNDLVKRAASELDLPYLCVPTAASVDGYTAYGAALLFEGFKQTMPCRAPLAVAADTSVLAAAPAFLTSSGFGDLAGKIIAGSDWIIAAAIESLLPGVPGAEPIDETAWNMVQSGLDRSLRRSVSAARGDRDAVTALFEALGITGFALQYMKNSRCVSGCEHMFSHVWEMENLCVNGVPVTHGHKVALGTLAAAACTECLFAEKPAPRPRPSWAEREAQARAAFAGLGRAGDAAVNTVRSKFMEGEAASALEQAALDSWDALRTAVFEKLPPYADIRAMLGEAGCPVRPEQIGLTKTRVIAAAVKAQMIRCRFTALDLAYETGAFSDVLKRVEASNKYLC